MLKNWGRLVVLLGCSVGFSISANAEWYMDITYSGIDGGLKGDGERLNFFSELDVDNTSAGWQISAGFSVNQYTAFEIGYVDLGHQTANVNFQPCSDFISSGCGPGIIRPPFFSFSPTSTSLTADSVSGWAYTPGDYPGGSVSGFVSHPVGDAFAFPGGVTAGSKVDTRLKGLRLAMIGNLPITERISGSFQGGALIPEYRVSTTSVREVVKFDLSTGSYIVTQYFEKETETSHEPALFIGLGFQVDLSSKIAMKLSWEKYLDVGEGDYLEQSLDTYNLSMRLHF